MKRHCKLFHLFMALIMLMTYLTIPSAIADDTVTVTLNVTNTPVRGDVVLEKKGLQLVRFQNETDANGYSIMKPVYENGYLAGAKFELHAAENIVGREGTTFYTKDQKIETLTTTSTGSVKSSLLPLGKYYLVEVSAPDGYVYSTERCNFTLSAIDKKTAVVEVKVSASNTYLPIKVSLEKKKEQTTIKNLDNGMVHQVIEVVAGEGFVFGLYNSSVINYANNQQLPANTLMATAKTDKNGNLVISGQYPHGNYYLKELAVPDGWKLSTQKFPVVLTSANKASNENTIVVKLAEPILNELIYIPVTITKTDITGAEKLPGALIEVYDENRTLIYREYTNENGEIPDIPVVPGNYTFKETYAPEGYALNVAIMDFTVTKDGKVVGRTTIKDEVNHVELLKTRENGDPLEGCVFGLFNEKGAKIMEATSGADGIVQFKKIPYGKYTIKEISAPYGFHASKNTWKVNVDGTYINPIKVLDTVVNEDAPGWIKVRKIDELDGHAIAGVQFDIFAVKEDGTAGDLVSTMVTNEDGIATSEDLLVGDYLVKEHENPVGYKYELWSEKITVFMDKTIERTVKNMPLQGKIKIVKTDDETKKGLPGAVFTVTRVSGLPSHNGEDVGEIVAVLTTDENGLAETPLLTWGEYKVVETHVPDDYIDDGYEVTIKVPGE